MYEMIFSKEKFDELKNSIGEDYIIENEIINNIEKIIENVGYRNSQNAHHDILACILYTIQKSWPDFLPNSFDNYSKICQCFNLNPFAILSCCNYLHNNEATYKGSRSLASVYFKGLENTTSNMLSSFDNDVYRKLINNEPEINGDYEHKADSEIEKQDLLQNRDGFWLYHGMVFRGDTRDPAEIFSQGFSTKMVSELNHEEIDFSNVTMETISGQEDRSTLGYGISTTKDISLACEYAKKVYIIDTKNMKSAYDVNENYFDKYRDQLMTRENIGEMRANMEVNCPTNIHPKRIYGMIDFSDETVKIHKNPHYEKQDYNADRRLYKTGNIERYLGKKDYNDQYLINSFNLEDPQEYCSKFSVEKFGRNPQEEALAVPALLPKGRPPKITRLNPILLNAMLQNKGSFPFLVDHNPIIR